MANKQLYDFGYHRVSTRMGEHGRGAFSAWGTCSTSGQAWQAGRAMAAVLHNLLAGMIANMLDTTPFTGS